MYIERGFYFLPLRSRLFHLCFAVMLRMYVASLEVCFETPPAPVAYLCRYSPLKSPTP